MGYGSSSKGGGGSGNSGGGKKKGRQKQPKPREFKVKPPTSAAAASPPPPLPAFTVIAPDPEERARLLAARKREERNANARKEALYVPVNGTSKTHGRTLGTGADADVDTADDDRATTIPLPQTPTSTTDREKRLAFLALQETNAENLRLEQKKAEKLRRDAPFVEPIRASQQNLERLAERLSSEELEDVRRLLGVVLNNATKSDPKYRLLKASNDNLWRRLLRYPEIVTIFEAGGFQRENNVANKRAAKVEALRIELERNRINLLIAQALDHSLSLPDPPNTPEAVIVSLVMDLVALEVEEQALMRSCIVVDEVVNDAKDRNFELCHPGTGDGQNKQILAILRVVNGNCGNGNLTKNGS
mmetsp:Transcript_37362/g.45054  ORF Transcript_37362/g.45054 Transcript_37362/m.45054 type:complete len:360 (-) Transcript_37362:379-1458(-)